MNIVHISPNAPYNEGWGFQENLLPKYHARLGHEVTLVVSNRGRVNGKTIEEKTGTFASNGGFQVIRLPYKQYAVKALTTVFWKLDVYELLCRLQPDFIFYHGLVSRTIFDVIKYKKQREKQGRECAVVQDNHLDYNIGCDPRTFKQKLLRSYYRMLNRRSQKSVEKVYGVTPWRKLYAEEYFGIDKAKTDVLIMGADDEKIDFAHREPIRREIRERYGIADRDFLVVTGGKIDEKKKIHLLMEACGGMEGVKLLVFGSVSQQLQAEYQRLVEQYDNIISVGWLDAHKVYDYFFAADLVCFPGQHSVLWEQACAAKVPCLFARWPGMEHVDNGGNSDFVDEITAETLREKIGALRFTEKYRAMQAVAGSEATDIYRYSGIARKSLEL